MSDPQYCFHKLPKAFFLGLYWGFFEDKVSGVYRNYPLLSFLVLSRKFL